MDADKDLSIEHSLIGKTGKVALTVRLGGTAAKVFKTDILDETTREEAKAQLQQEFPALQNLELASQVSAKLLEIAEEVARTLAHRSVGQPSSEDPARDDCSSEELLAAMPEEIRREAAAMLADPELIRRVLVDIAALGVAGEHELTATIYVVGTSRLLDQPLAAIVQGPSSSGKSYPIRKVSDLFPPESVIHATQISPQALFYMKPGSLVHKFVVAGERSRRQDDEAAEATRALREMLSEGRLDKHVPMKIDGRIETKRVHQDGPIGYVESTTSTKIFEEDANRCILLQTDERPEQTRRVFAAVAAEFSGGRASIESQRLIQLHWAAQRILRPVPVVIPYADRLAETLPVDRVEARRAIGHLMNMIAAVTLLHQRQRPTDTDGRLTATVEDYQLAHRLLDKPMARLLGRRVSDAALRFHDRLAQRFSGVQFTTHEVAQGESVSDRSVRGWLSELYGAGYVELVESGRGPKPNIWRLAAVPPPEGAAALPSVEQVFPELRFRVSDNARPA